MTRLSPRHPRYRSLRTRKRLGEAFRKGLVVPEGLIAQGRAEAFDYFLGERTLPSARRAERLAVQWLRAAEWPVISVNGNVAALAADRIGALTRLEPRISVEINLFHRTDRRVRLIARALRAAGVRKPLGLHPTARIPRLPSDRALVDTRGILRADVCLVPLEDGDRTQALRALGKRVISIDLNPLSRTSRSANLPIVDELTRALDRLAEDLRRPHPPIVAARFARVDSQALLRSALNTMDRNLKRARPPRSPTD
jgi:4-phosphopantoate---beta-alanine ligase